MVPVAVVLLCTGLALADSGVKAVEAPVVKPAMEKRLDVAARPISKENDDGL